MRKVALVFVLAVFVPSLVLAWLAVRSLRDQQFLLERQQSLLYQGVADAKAKEVQDALAEYQHGFTLQVAKLVGKRNPRALPARLMTCCGRSGRWRRSASPSAWRARSRRPRSTAAPKRANSWTTTAASWRTARARMFT